MPQPTTIPVTASHTGDPSPTSASDVRDGSTSSTSHVDKLHPVATSHAGGITLVSMSHINVTSPTSIPELWFSPEGPLSSEVSVVSPHPVSPLIDTAVMSLQSSPDHTPIVEGDVSPIHVITHPLQPTIEEVVIPVQSLVNPTLTFEGDASSNMLLAFIIMHLLNKREFYSPQVLSLQVLRIFPLIGMVLWGIQCLLLCTFQ
jgi:hypothetical protein